MQALRIALMGESAVGKTSFARRLCSNSFDAAYTPTLGTHIYDATAYLPGSVNDEATVSLCLTDVSGAVSASQLARNLLASTDIILLMFDITQSFSFQQITIWANYLLRAFQVLNNDGHNFSMPDRISDALGVDMSQRNGKRRKRPYMVLIACKGDLSACRMVRQEQINQLSTELGLPCYLTSSKSGENVVTTIIQITLDIIGAPNMTDVKLPLPNKRPSTMYSDRRRASENPNTSKACVIQ